MDTIKLDITNDKESRTKIYLSHKCLPQTNLETIVRRTSLLTSFQIFSRLEDSDCQASRKRAFRNLLTTILETSTIMPFRWFSNKYMCFYCCASFVDSFKLKQHTKEEHVDPKLRNVLRSRDLGYTRVKLDVSETRCKRCLKCFQNFQAFLDHSVDEHHVGYDKDLLQYLISFKLSDEGMRCEDCGEGFRFFGTLLTHMHKCHNRINTYLCEVCGRGFIAKSTLDCHVRTAHTTTESQKCQKCNRIFPSQYALSNHYSKTHRYESFKCSKCPEVFKSRYLKKRHLAMVHDVKSSQFSCSECDKIFTVKSALLQHVSRVHLKEKSFACEICGFKVFSKDLLKRHMVKHDDSRPFQCEFCKKSFQRKKTLEFHRRIHTNDKRYICKDCGKAFVQVASLKLHIRVHHSIGNDNT